jgi:hypothetical protein
VRKRSTTWRSKAENGPVRRRRRRVARWTRVHLRRPPFSRLAAWPPSAPEVSPAPAPARTHTCFHACVCSCPRLPNAGPRRPCPCPHRAYAYSYTLAHARAPTRARANSLLPVRYRSPASSCLQHALILTPPQPPAHPLNHFLPLTPTISMRRSLRRVEALSLHGGQRCVTATPRILVGG